jgi:methyl coenzyme M reductase system subunit A2
MREVVLKITMPDNWVKDVCKKYPTHIKFIECMPYGKSRGRGLIEIRWENTDEIIAEIKNLCVGFDGVDVLKNINLEIKEGEILGILGKSSAGKSILMLILRGVDTFENVSGNVIYHLSRCSNGYIELPGKAGTACPICHTTFEKFDVDFVKLPIHDHLRKEITRKIAIMIQRTFALYGDERVIVNVMNALEEIGELGPDAINRAADLLDQVNLSNRMMHIARELSGI